MLKSTRYWLGCVGEECLDILNLEFSVKFWKFKNSLPLSIHSTTPYSQLTAQEVWVLVYALEVLHSPHMILAGVASLPSSIEAGPCTHPLSSVVVWLGSRLVMVAVVGASLLDFALLGLHNRHQ